MTPRPFSIVGSVSNQRQRPLFLQLLLQQSASVLHGSLRSPQVGAQAGSDEQSESLQSV